MKRTALALTLMFLLFSAVAGTELVKMAEANPWFIFDPVTPIPGTIPPIITILSPENTSYAYTTVNLTLHITKPQPPYQLESGISYARYTLDGNPASIYFCNEYSSDSPPGIPELNYSQILSPLPDGNHELVVEAAGVVLPGQLKIFTMYTNSTVFFTTSHTLSSPSPSPSPAPSPEPTSTPSPSATPIPSETPKPTPETQSLEHFQTILVTTASGASISITAISLLVYFKKRKR